VLRARAALSTITLVPIDGPTLERAPDLAPRELRSLDALHLAAALSLAGDLGRMYCYDARLAAAGTRLGLDVRRPR